MKKIFTMTLLFMLSLQLNATNLSEENLVKAQAVIDKSVEAYGGSDKLTALKQMRISSDVTQTANHQSFKPDPPWDKHTSTELNAIDLDKKMHMRSYFRNDVRGESSSKVIHYEQSGLRVDLINRTYSDFEAPVDFMQVIEPFIRVTTPLLIKQLMQQAGTSSYLGEVNLNNKPHDVIKFVMVTGSAISLYFDKATHLISKSDRLVRFGLLESYFGDYTMIDGVLFNQHFRRTYEGRDYLEQTNTISAINQPINDYLAIDKSFNKIRASTTDANEFKIDELDDGVYFVGNGMSHFLFVDMGDYLISIGGTTSANDKLAAVIEKTGDKPLRYGVLTHHHLSNIQAVGSLSQAGATILTVKENTAAINDSLRNNQKIEMEFVENNRVFESKSQRLEIIDIGPTPHAEHFLIAYLPKSGIVFEADHFSASATDLVKPASRNAITLAAAFKKHKLNVKRIASAQSSYVAGIEKLNEAVAKAK